MLKKLFVSALLVSAIALVPLAAQAHRRVIVVHHPHHHHVIVIHHPHHR